jgi:hypothetical protein
MRQEKENNLARLMVIRRQKETDFLMDFEISIQILMETNFPKDFEKKIRMRILTSILKWKHF